MTFATNPTQWRGRKVGDIAAAVPGATAIFRRFKLDFCCGGDIALEEAARRGGIDIAAVEQALGGLRPSPAPLEAGQQTPALIDHILGRYHETHRRELPELIALATKVEAVHVAHPQAPHGLADTLRRMWGELEVHMKKEELILFPAMRRGPRGPLDAPIGQMRHDHDDHAAHLRRLTEMTGGFAPPEGACRTWRALYVGTAKLADDLMEHIHLENNVLFPRYQTPPAE